MPLSSRTDKPALTRTLQRSQPLQEQTYQALRTAILSGELAAGQRLVETQLAKQLQVSRTPIREAMRLLQHESLITIDSNGGMRVAVISVTDAMQLYDCRIALEALSVTGACKNATKSQLRDLELIVLQAEKLTKPKSSQLNNFRMLDIDYQFHRLLAQSSGNPWLVTLLDQVFDKMLLLRIQTMKHNPEVLEIRSEHRRVYESVRSQEPELAVQTIREHLTASKERVIREIKQLQQDVDAAQ